MKLSLTVNGQDLICDVQPSDRLSKVLRDDLGLTGTKVGCDAGDCGACTVLADGAPICACLTAAKQVAGARIETAEGLAKEGDLSRLQQSFLHHGAAQCGVCTPGMLMSAKALLDRNPCPERREIEDALGGVLCRCTGYAKIVDAVMNANAFIEPVAEPEIGAQIGARIRHLDGQPKVNGTLAYGADIVPDNALTVRVVRSPHHSARFEFGDIDAFMAANPGIEFVLKASDVPGRNCFGTIPLFADQTVFAEVIARYRGDAVAAIVGTRDAVCSVDEAAFPIEWEIVSHSLMPAEATSKAAPQMHEGREGNVLVTGFVAQGDAETALANAAHRVSVSISTPSIEHAYIEPEAGYAMRVGDRLEVFGCTQAPQMDRESLAQILGLPESSIRVRPSACGGGFGSKLDLSFQPYVALAAWLTGRTATIAYSRGESMRATTKRHPSEIELTVGCDDEGRIRGLDFRGVFNTGAYASWGPTVANRVPVHASGPYYVSDYRAYAKAVHTNCPPSGAFRGFGVPQSAIAQETAFDRLADAAGIDRLKFRRINALRDGQPTVTGQVFDEGVGIVDCLDALVPAWNRANDNAKKFNTAAGSSPLRKGVGVASCWYGCGNTSLPNPSTIRLGIRADATVVLHQGAVDIGQGSNTVISQIAADSLGIPVASLFLVDADTDLTPDCGKTSASRQTFVSGNAAALAGKALRAEILRRGNVGEDAALLFDEGRIEMDDAGTRATIDLCDMPADANGYVLAAEETYDPPVKPLDERGQGNPYAVYGYGVQLVELTVDTALGTVKVDRVTTAHDVGRAINPLLVEGQIEGGVVQGIGMALMEEYIPGRTENLHDYLIPTIGDVPEFEHHLIEVADPEGPYGAKGLGEHVLIPTAPAILNAIRDATGAIISDLPATPHRVLAALRARQETAE